MAYASDFTRGEGQKIIATIIGRTGHLRNSDCGMLGKIPPFFLALLISSLTVNVALFLSPYKWENDKYPPGEQRSNQTNTDKGDARDFGGARVTGIQIECDPNCSAKNPDDHRNESALARFFRKTLDDPLIAFTGVLAVATFVLAIYTGTVANATKAAAEHIPRVERAYVSGGAGFPTQKLPAGGTQIDFSKLQVTINNYGKTPAFIGTVAIAVCNESELASPPPWADMKWEGYVLPAPTKSYPSDVTCQRAKKIVFGRIWYRDIFGDCYSCGFALWSETGLNAVAGHDEYWEDRPECNLGPAS